MATDPEKIDVSDLSDVVLNESSSTDTQGLKPKKRPKRILHFSDGDLEEYSEDETDAPEENITTSHIDPKTLNWMPWAWYQTSWFGTKLLDGCDYAGEWLANFFGITSPKYQFEINEFYRLQALENEMTHKQDLEMGGWNEQNKNNLIHDNSKQ
ncbi:protein FAM177A1 isoform X2 [Colletes gigas]|nr:protein FAM177A1 isoform X2 [Colletes gigas]XP_043249640.1 protein FAM177A1 isoform X2 [Colletes gigas]XP_043249641.1 protein FAM177A1 isoform X2 [Colletes gigas]